MKRLTQITLLLVWLAVNPSVIGQATFNSDTLPRVRGALESLRANLRGNQDREERWTKVLLLDEVAELVKQGANADPEDIGKTIDALAAAERPLDPRRVESLRDALGQWLAQSTAPVAPQLEPADAEATGQAEPQAAVELAAEGADKVIAAADDLEAWITRNGPRYAGWLEALDLEAIKRSAQSPESAQRSDVQSQFERLVEEAKRPDRGDCERLRRGLQHWQDELRTPLDEPLSVAARRGRVPYPGIDFGRLSNTRLRLEQATRRLDSFLAGSEQHGDNWRQYLRLERLQTELNDPAIPRVSPLLSVYEKFNSGEPGLRMSQFADVRAALDDYIQMLTLYEVRPERVTETRRDLQSAVEELDRFLARGSEQRQRLWKEFLLWETLAEQLPDPRPDVRQLNNVLKKYQSGESGLDHSKFRRVARRLAKYMEIVQVTAGPFADDTYSRRMESMAQTLEEHTLDPSNDTAAKLTGDLKWLRATGLQPGLISRVEQFSSQPNLFAAISGEFVSKAIRDRITDVQPVNQCFEGSHVTGTATTIADVRGALRPSDNGAIIEILLGGSTVTNTVARQRSVYVTTQGTTQIQAGTRLYLNLEGISAEQASASASTRQQVCGICVDRNCGRRLISRIAGRRADESRPRAECSQTQEARQTITKRVNQQVSEMVSQANRRMQELKDQLDVDEELMPDLWMRSTDRKILANGKLTVGRFLASPSQPPDVGSESDVSLRLHQSAINNVLAQMLGGIKIDNERMVEILEENNLAVPPELLPKGASNGESSTTDGDDDEEDEEDEYWSITFDVGQPATVTFTDGKIDISVLGRRFEQGGQKVNEPIRITATYRLRKNDLLQLEARRVGDLDVVFINTPGRLRTRQLAQKTFIKGKMEALFKSRISLDDLPESEMTSQLASLKLDHVEATRGWLAVALALDNIDLGMGSSSSTSSVFDPSIRPTAMPVSPIGCLTCVNTSSACNNCGRRRGFARRR